MAADENDIPADSPEPGGLPADEHPHCPACGYDLSGTPGRYWRRCPECGWEFRCSELISGPMPGQVRLGWDRFFEFLRRRIPLVQRVLLVGLFLTPTLAAVVPEFFRPPFWMHRPFEIVTAFGGAPILLMWACLLLWLRGVPLWLLFALPLAAVGMAATVVLTYFGMTIGFVLRFGLRGWQCVGTSAILVGVFVGFVWFVRRNHTQSDEPLDDYNPGP